MALTAEQILAAWILKARDLVTIADQVPYRPSFLQSLNLTTFKSLTTTEVKVWQKEHGALNLVQTTERGGPIEQDMPEGSKLYTLPTFRVAKGATIRSHELQDVFAFGSNNVRERIGAKLAERFMGLEEDITLTEEHMLMGMIQGLILDADGSVLMDCYDQFDTVVPANFTMDWANWDIGQARVFFNQLTRELTREMSGLGGAGRWVALCGDAAYDAMISSPAIKELYATHAGARELESIGQPYESTPFARIQWYNYRGTDDMTTIKIPDNEVRLFPVGVNGLFLDCRAPGESIDDLNRAGKRRHPIQITDKDRKFWIKNELYTYPSYLCTRPGVLRKGTLA